LQVFGEGTAPVDTTADVVGQLIYDAIMLDTSKHMPPTPPAGAGGEPPAPPPKHKPTYGKTTRRLLRQLVAAPFNSSTQYNGVPVRPGSAQLASLQFLRVFTALSRMVHARLRAQPDLVVPDNARHWVRGVVGLFMTSGRTPYEGAWEAPGATACMVLDADSPEELVTIGNVVATSAVSARAQITATLDRIASGDVDAAMMDDGLLSGGPGKDLPAETRAALEAAVTARLAEFEADAFGEDAGTVPSAEEMAAQAAAAGAEAA
jgi:hypothetical protein